MIAWRLALASFLGPRGCCAVRAGKVEERALDRLSCTLCCAADASLRCVLGSRGACKIESAGTHMTHARDVEGSWRLAAFAC